MPGFVVAAVVVAVAVAAVLVVEVTAAMVMMMASAAPGCLRVRSGSECEDLATVTADRGGYTPGGRPPSTRAGGWGRSSEEQTNSEFSEWDDAIPVRGSVRLPSASLNHCDEKKKKKSSTVPCKTSQAIT